jgi:nicotinate-nucleotide adenylyltransferase
VIGLYGGAFDPPHNGHVELANVAKEHFGLSRLVVLVAAAPGHKRVETPPELRLEMARAAFPDDAVVLDEHARTVETLRAHPEWTDPVFLIGADQFTDFLTWTEPQEVLRRTRLAVATRPGYPRERLEPVLERLEHPERVLFFEIQPVPVASSELRSRLESGDSIRDLVPEPVCEIIVREGLYKPATPVK